LTYDGTTWSPRLPLGSESVDVVSCSSASFCAGAGSAGFRYFDGTSWSAVERFDTGQSIDLLSCPSRTFCLAVDSEGRSHTYDGNAWSPPQQIAGGPWRSLTCAAPRSCLLVVGANVVSGYDGSWSAPRTVLHTQGHPWAVDCVGTTFCMAVDREGSALRYDGTGWSTPETIGDRPLETLPSVSCASPAFCVAVLDGAVATFDGTAWSEPAQVSPEGFSAVSCASSTMCVASDWEGGAYVYDGHVWRHGQVTADIHTGLTSVSCASAAFCVALDETGAAYRFDGSTWAVMRAPDIRAQSVSCTSPSFCAIAGSGPFDTGLAATYDGANWSTTLVGSAGPLDCASADFCAMRGPRGTSTYDGSHWSAPAPLAGFSSELGSLWPHALSCGTSTFCAAVNADGYAVIGEA
jgi:hypothetical protein